MGQFWALKLRFVANVALVGSHVIVRSLKPSTKIVFFHPWIE